MPRSGRLTRTPLLRQSVEGRADELQCINSRCTCRGVVGTSRRLGGSETASVSHRTLLWSDEAGK